MIFTLHHQRFGIDEGTPLVILHGLFGSLENWGSQARKLGTEHTVYCLDLRNHGRSPHSERMDYRVMALDVLRTLDELGLDKVLLMGHSMGGKAAMQLALDAPHRVEKLIVVDIAPRSYPRWHDDIFAALRDLDLTGLPSRAAADAEIIDKVPDIALTPEGDAPLPKPALFVKGELSDYITAQDREPILELFPTAEYKIIQNAGHWPHVEKADTFRRVVSEFLAARKTR